MAECPCCHRFSLDYDAVRKRARCLYGADCGFTSNLKTVVDRSDFHRQYGYGGRLVGEPPA